MEKVELPYDKMKEQRRNFVFIEFDSPDTVTKVMAQESHTIGEMEVSAELLPLHHILSKVIKLQII